MEGVKLLDVIEVTLIAVTAIVTVLTAFFVGRQASHHFRLERSTHFIERFNSGDLLRMRPRVDAFIALAPCWDGILQDQEKALLDEATRALLYETTVFANFFQELATALRHKTLDHAYTWDVFGGIVTTYRKKLSPFIQAKRVHHQRPTLYQDFEMLVIEMGRLER